MKSIVEISEYLKRRGERLRPLKSAEIKKVEDFYQVELPKTYKQFLSLMGKGAGNYMMGSQVFYDNIFSLKEWGNELMNENNITSIPENCFFFWMHQGYQAACFRLTDGDDPPVYYFSEGDDVPMLQLKEKSLTDFFVTQLYMSYLDLANGNVSI